MWNFVINFGNLEPDEEKIYIENMVEKPIKRINKDILNQEQIKNIHNFATLLVSKAQNFFRGHYDISSVSLMNIKRFNKL